MSLLSLFIRRRPKRPARRRGPAKVARPAGPVTAQVVIGGAAVAAAVAHLCQSRACLALRLPVAKGDRLSVRLFNGACLYSVTAEARVTWCERDGAACRVGCQFLSPLPAADLLPLLG